jgi:hypothetical protein
MRCLSRPKHLLTSLFSQIMDVFCARMSADPRSIRFLYDGNVLDLNATPEKLGMEDGDTIDAMLSQIGGLP